MMIVTNVAPKRKVSVYYAQDRSSVVRILTCKEQLMKIGHFFFAGQSWFDKFWRFLAPLADLFIRLWIAEVFFRSALTKITTWESTVFLFQHDYSKSFVRCLIILSVANA